MEFQALAVVFACLTLTESRETSKTTKSSPTIASSLVNFGKMDISLHFNVNDRPSRTGYLGPSDAYLFSKPEPIEGPCPCSGSRSLKDPFFNNPSDVLRKILMSNDLFSHNKEPVTSTLCCDSHEHDDFVTFELGTRHINEKPVWSLPTLPFIFENMLPKKPLPSSKPQAVEIIMHPKKQSPIKMAMKKDAIQIVGDKELRNDFKTMNFMPRLPVVSSVKKDLTAQVKIGAMNKENKLSIFDEGLNVNTNGVKKESITNSPNALK